MQHALTEIDGRARLVDAVECKALDAPQTAYHSCRQGMPLKIVYGTFMAQPGPFDPKVLQTAETELTYFDGGACRRLRLIDIVIYPAVQQIRATWIPFAALVESDARIGDGHRISAYVKPMGPNLLSDVANRCGIYAMRAQEKKIKGMTRDNWKSYVRESRVIAAVPSSGCR